MLSYIVSSGPAFTIGNPVLLQPHTHQHPKPKPYWKVSALISYYIQNVSNLISTLNSWPLLQFYISLLFIDILGTWPSTTVHRLLAEWIGF